MKADEGQTREYILKNLFDLGLFSAEAEIEWVPARGDIPTGSSGMAPPVVAVVMGVAFTTFFSVPIRGVCYGGHSVSAFLRNPHTGKNGWLNIADKKHLLTLFKDGGRGVDYKTGKLTSACLSHFELEDAAAREVPKVQVHVAKELLKRGIITKLSQVARWEGGAAVLMSGHAYLFGRFDLPQAPAGYMDADGVFGGRELRLCWWTEFQVPQVEVRVRGRSTSYIPTEPRIERGWAVVGVGRPLNYSTGEYISQ